MEAPEPRTVPLAEAGRLLERGEAVLVDVREPDEWSAGHAPGALHIPIGDLDPRRVPADVEIITTCRSGGRGARAAAALTAAGLPARSLDGGMRGWQDAGLPVVDGDRNPGAVS